MTSGRAKHRLLMKLKLGALVVPVVHHPELEDQGAWDEDGCKEVWVSKLPAEDPTFSQTVLHEVLHAISDLYGLKLTEQKVLVLENALAQLITDNPSFIRLLSRRKVS